MKPTFQNFPIEVVLSIVGDRLLCDIDGVYGICNFLSGDSLYTHQLVRATNILKPWILEQHPQLSDWDDSEINARNYRQYVEKARALYGRSLQLLPIPRERWTHIDPIEEARAMVGDDKVIVIKPE